MRRTLQTTLIALKWLVDSGVPVSVDPMWQGLCFCYQSDIDETKILRNIPENSTDKCNTGRPLCETSQHFPTLDFSNVDSVYPNKSIGTPYAFTALANKARGEACLKALYDRPEKVIAVVSHSSFLRTGISRRKFANADYRIFTFGSGEQGHLELFEDGVTERRGGGLGRSQRGVWKVREDDFPLESIGDECDDKKE